MPRLRPIAVDTNILFDLVQEVEVVIDCLETIAKRIPNSSIIVLPTVILELRKWAMIIRGPAHRLKVVRTPPDVE